MGKRRWLILAVLILVLILAGCGPLHGPLCQPGPVDYEEAGQIYLDQWLVGVRQMVVESCNAQPDPAGCRAAWRAAVNAVGGGANGDGRGMGSTGGE